MLFHSLIPYNSPFLSLAIFLVVFLSIMVNSWYAIQHFPRYTYLYLKEIAIFTQNYERTRFGGICRNIANFLERHFICQSTGLLSLSCRWFEFPLLVCLTNIVVL